MSNSNLTLDVIAKEAMRVGHEKATFIGTVNRSYDSEFSNASSRGWKNGASLRIAYPNEYTVSTSSRVMDVQDQTEASTTLTVGYQYHVDMRLNSAELSLSVPEFSDRHVKPAMSVLMSKIDQVAIETGTKETYNLVGTAGTVIGAVSSGFSDTSALGNARAKLNQYLAPKDSNRSAQFDSVTMASLTNGIKPLFHPQAVVEEAFREGFIGKSQMAEFYENERTWTMTNGADVTGTTDAAAGVTDGGSTLSADTASPVTYTVGQVFTIAGVFAAHQETKASLGHLQQFTNTAGTGSGGDFTISPKTYLTGPKQNVCSAAGAQLATTDFDSKTLTAVGAVTTSYRQNLMYHRDAFAFVTADLPLMAGADKCVRMNQDGFALRVWQDGDIRNDELLMRIDMLWGFATLRPAWACRITN